MLLNIYITVSILADAGITILGNTINSISDIWKPIVLFAALFLTCIIFHVILLIASSFLSREEGKIVKPTRWMVIQTINLLRRVMRLKIHTTGMELLPEGQSFLLVCNHKSIFEPIASIELFRDYRLGFISKKENSKIPIGGWLINSTATLALDREDDRAAVRTVIKAANIIKKGEASFGIYPEGTRNKTSEPLLPFRNGSFKIAQRAGAPIVVMTACGAERLTKRMFFRKTDAYFDILKVIPHEDIASLSTNEIGDMISGMMKENIIKRNSEVYGRK